MEVLWSQGAEDCFFLGCITGPGTAQSVVCWACCPAWCSIMGSILLWTSGKGCFSFGVNMGSPKSPSDESINRGLVCAHMHSIAWTRTLTFMSETGECWQQKHIQHAPFMKTECDDRYDWIKKQVAYVEISPKMVNPRDIAGNAEEEECLTSKQQAECV